MAFQKAVKREPAKVLPGGWGSGNNYNAVAAMAGEPIRVGRFCHLEDMGSGSGPAYMEGVTAEGAMVVPTAKMGDGTNLRSVGIALRYRIATIVNLKDEAVQDIEPGFPCEIQTSGDGVVFFNAAEVSDLSVVRPGAIVCYRTGNTAAAGEPSNAGSVAFVADPDTAPPSGFAMSNWQVVSMMDMDSEADYYTVKVSSVILQGAPTAFKGA